MTEAPGGGGSKTVPKTVAEIFWVATSEREGKRTPETVVQHALANIKAFNAGAVRDLGAAGPLTLMDLMARSGLEEDLIYASPELARGEAIDERSLVFSLGVLIFERLTDRHPFGAADNTSRVARLRRYEMGSGVNFIPTLPKGLREILMRAMGPFPEERYLALDEMTADLQRFLEHKLWTDPKPQFTPAAPPEKRPRFKDAPTAAAEPLFDFSSGVHKIPTEKQGQVKAVLAGNRADSAPGAASSASPPPSSTTRDDDIFSDLPEEWAPDAQAQQLMNTPTEPEISIGEASSLPSAPPEEASPRPAAPAAPAAPRAESGAAPAPDLGKESPPPPRSEPTPAQGERSRALDPVDSGLDADTVKVVKAAMPFGRWTPVAFIFIGAGLASLLFIILLSLQKKPAVQVSDPTVQAVARPGGAADAPPAHPKSSRVIAPSVAPTATPGAPAPSAPSAAPAPPAAPAAAAASAPAAPPAAPPVPAPPAPPASVKPPASPVKALPAGLDPETTAGVMVARLIRGCGLAERGNRGLRVAVYINPPNKILRAFANVKQGITARQVQCIRRAVIGRTLEFSWAKAGFIEWSLRFAPEGETARVVGPRKLRERMKKRN